MKLMQKYLSSLKKHSFMHSYVILVSLMLFLPLPNIKEESKQIIKWKFKNGRHIFKLQQYLITNKKETANIHASAFVFLKQKESSASCMFCGCGYL